jgi:hypothetical protein
MKIYINKYILGGLIAVASIASSCSSDYLNTNPTASIGTSTVFATTENAAMAINGICEVMTTQQYAFSQGADGEGRIKILYGEYPGPNYIYNYYAPGWAALMNSTFNSRTSSAYCAYPWYYYYTIIGNANSIIANIDKATGTDADKEFIKAQALTFRAYGYEQLMQFYTYRWQDTNSGATQGVPLRIDESTGDLACSTVAQCYAQIYKDCQDAIDLFTKSGESRDASQVWKPNINVAYATYARAALNRQDYATALTNAKLARQNYPLMSTTDYVSGFCKPTSEWIWGSYGDATENQWYWSYGTQFSCNGYFGSSQPTGAGAIERKLINRIPNNDVRKSLFLTEDKFPGYDWTKGNILQQTYGIFWDDGLAAKAQAYIAKITPSGLTTAYQSGYYYLDGQLKFWVFDTPGVSYLPHFRSSEMVLIEAEANYFLNKATDAQNSLIELNKTSGRNPDYTCTKTGDDLFQEIVDYRGLELYGEGFSWYDYKRWKKDMQRTSIANGGNAHQVIASKILATDNNNWTWSIPLAETDYNSSVTPN